MITCNGTFAPWVLWLITIGTAERVHLHHVVEASRQVDIGATEEEVLAILGEPKARYAERSGWFFGRPRQWMYGTTINLHHVIVPGIPVPILIPINIRWFGYDTDDLVIDWTRDGKVAKIVRPELDLPDGARGVCEFLEVVRVWGSAVQERVGS